MTERDLRRALDFDEDDLAANRVGQLSARQKQKLRAARRRLALTRGGAFVALFGLTAVFLFFGQQNDVVVLVLLGVAVSILNALVAGSLLRDWLRLSADLESARVEVLNGRIGHTIRVMGRAASYVVTVGDEELTVPRETFLALEDDMPYRLYRAPHSRLILSAERVADSA